MANDFHLFLFYLLASRGCNYTRNFERVAGLNRESLAPLNPAKKKPSEKDFKPGFKEKIRFFLKEKKGR